MVQNGLKYCHFFISHHCLYNDGWLRSFKLCRDIRYFEVHRENHSNSIGAEEYLNKFVEMLHDENLSPEQIYNADETALC